LQFNFTHLYLPGIKIPYRVQHTDLDLSCNATYHVERYLEEKDIYLDMFEYKYEDIKDLLKDCRGAGDIESLLSPETFQGRPEGISGNAKTGLTSSHREPGVITSPPSAASRPTLGSTSSERKPRKTQKSKSLSLSNIQSEGSARHKHSRTLSNSIVSPISGHRRQSVAEDTVEMGYINTPQTSTPREINSDRNITTHTSMH
jgi:hypothetical protein